MFTSTKLLVPTLLLTLTTSPLLARVMIMPPIHPAPPIIIDPPICPDPPPGYSYRWVEPVYRTVTERIWIEERTQRIEEWVQVEPGRWERRWRTIIIPGHFETVTRRVLVSEGYWQLVKIYPSPHPIPFPRPVIITPSPGTVGVEGYSQRSTEDLSKFSGLSEWPDRK